MEFLVTIGVLLAIFLIIGLGIFMVGSFFEPKRGDGSNWDKKLTAEADAKISATFDGVKPIATYEITKGQQWPRKGELIERAHDLGYTLTSSSDSGPTSTLVFERQGNAEEPEATKPYAYQENMRQMARPARSRVEKWWDERKAAR